MANGGGTDGRKDGRTDGRMEIPPCVLQDIGPLGPLPKKVNPMPSIQAGAVMQKPPVNAKKPNGDQQTDGYAGL